MSSSVIGIKGKTCLVAQGTSGVGGDIAERLLAQGAEVLVSGSDAAQGEAFVSEMRRDRPRAQIAFLDGDMGSKTSVMTLAARVREHHLRRPRLDVLVNVVRAAGFWRGTTGDGLDRAVAQNLLGPFLLTELLLPTLRASTPARIVNVCRARRGASVALDELQGDRRFEAVAACAKTNIGLLVLTHELARRLDGSGIVVNSADLAEPRFGMHVGLARSAETASWLATAPETAAVTARHFVGRTPTPPPAAAYDRAVARRLWDACEHMLGLRVAA